MAGDVHLCRMTNIIKNHNKKRTNKNHLLRRDSGISRFKKSKIDQNVQNL